MAQRDYQGKWNSFFKTISFNWKKISENQFNIFTKSFSYFFGKLIDLKNNRVKPQNIFLKNYHYETHRMDNLPPVLSSDSSPGIKYGYTENSEFAREAEKTESKGIDSFEKKDSFDPNEITEHQDYRNRKQNSDLDKRYFTSGLEINQNDLHR